MVTAAMTGYMIVSVILLLNMLIAMMAKTFDRIWEHQEENHLITRANLVFRSSDAAPPPINLLKLPYQGLGKLLSGIVFGWYKCVDIYNWCTCGYSADYKNLEGGSETGMRRRVSLVKENFIARQRGLSDGSLSPGRGRNVKNLVKINLEYKEMLEKVTDYIEDNETDDAQEDKWRTTLIKRVAFMESESRAWKKKREDDAEKEPKSEGTTASEEPDETEKPPNPSKPPKDPSPSKDRNTKKSPPALSRTFSSGFQGMLNAFEKKGED